MSKKVVVASGYFDPIHYGHIEYLKKSKDLGDTLIVIVNNDRQASLKKGKPFMKAAERVKLVRSLECVDAALESMDEDRTVCKTLAALHPDIFANGGDQFNTSIPEAKICHELGIEMRDGLGGKIQSSSWLLAASKKHKEEQDTTTKKLEEETKQKEEETKQKEEKEIEDDKKEVVDGDARADDEKDNEASKPVEKKKAGKKKKKLKKKKKIAKKSDSKKTDSKKEGEVSQE